MEIEKYYKKITEALKLLSLNFNEQKEYFPDFVDLSFEILDTFEKAFVLLPQVLEANKITCDLVPNLLRLHFLINVELTNLEFEKLEDEDICDSENWNRIREISKDIINVLGESLEKPDSNFI